MLTVCEVCIKIKSVAGKWVGLKDLGDGNVHGMRSSG